VKGQCLAYGTSMQMQPRALKMQDNLVVAPSIKTVALEAKAIQDMEEYQDSLAGMKLEVGAERYIVDCIF